MDKEQEIINHYLKPLAKNKESLNLENDAAYLKNKNLVITTDMMIEDQHFKKELCPKLIARKLLRINLSDLAAMGAEPYGFLLNIAIPKNLTDEWLSNFTKGLKQDMTFFNLKLFGGDLSYSSKIFLNATILGKTRKLCHSKNYANLNSHIFVSGNLGDASLGFVVNNKPSSIYSPNSSEYLMKKLMIPNPRLEIGKKLVGKVEFCTDISDGLIRELLLVANNSKMKANIFLDKIPISSITKKILKNNKNKKKQIWEYILSGGEDYELLFGVGKNKIKLIKNIRDISKIGFFSEGKGLNIFDKDGKKINFKKKGFSHF